MKFSQIDKLRGLYVQPNTFGLPSGALEEAHNVTLEDQNTITKCRGFYDYYDYDIDDQEIIGLTTFDDHLVSVYSTFMAYYEDTGTAPNLTGTLNTIPQDSSIKISYTQPDNPTFVQASSNLYTTTDQGVIKLAAYDDTLRQSGSPQGLDVLGYFDVGTVATWWEDRNITGTDEYNSITVGYRIVFGYEDPNDNTILGAPSGILSFTNPAVYIEYDAGIPNIQVSGAGPYTIEITSDDHGLEDGTEITTLNPSPDPAGTWDQALGTFTIQNTTANTFEYEVDNDPGTPENISYMLAMQPRLEFSIPSQINNVDQGWFYQIFRSDQQIATVGVQSDFKLIDQKTITSTEITGGVAFYNDNQSELFKGEILYTNQNSGEGELQANFRPPKAETMDLFQKYLFYGNCTARHMLPFSVVDPTVLTTSSYVEVKVDDNYRRYRVGDGPGNLTVRSESVVSGLVTYTDHGIPVGRLAAIYINNANGGLADGVYYARAADANTFNFAASIADWQLPTPTYIVDPAITQLDFASLWQTLASPGGGPFAWTRSLGNVNISILGHGLEPGNSIYLSGSTGAIPIETGIYEVTEVPDANNFLINDGLGDSSGSISFNEIQYIWYDNNASSATPSEQIRDSADHLVKAINRDDLSSVYAQYVSSPLETPGNIRLQSKEFGGAISLRASDTTTSSTFFPELPTSFDSGTQVFSEDTSQINALYFSKLSEPEAVPLVNFIPVGSEKAEILAVHALTNSLIIIKSDGVFRLSGDNPSNFIASLLDGTVRGVARRSSTTFSNQVSLLSNQGICLISETSVQIISRPIENVIQTVVQDNLIDVDTAAVSYEIERQYLITTQDPDGNRVMYCYNVMTDSWSTWEFTFTSAAVGPDRKLYMVSEDRQTILKERKDNLKTDYSSQNYAVTVDSDDGNTTATITSPDRIPQHGDIIVKDTVINIIDTTTDLGGNQFQVNFFFDHNLEAADSLQLYSQYNATIRLAPITAGNVGLNKQFTQMQLHFKNHACNSLEISYGTDTFEDTGHVIWTQTTIPTAPKITADYKTKPAPIARLYVSRPAQRGTFLQPVVVGRIAGDKINLQSVNVSIRTYGERVSR